MTLLCRTVTHAGKRAALCRPFSFTEGGEVAVCPREAYTDE